MSMTIVLVAVDGAICSAWVKSALQQQYISTAVQGRFTTGDDDFFHEKESVIIAVNVPS